MTYNASLLASEAGRTINSRVRSIVNTTGAFKTKSESQPVTGSDLMRVMDEVFNANQTVLSLQDTPGLDQFYKDAYDDPAYDSLTELENQRVAMVDVGTTIRNSFPVDGDGYLLQYKFVNQIERVDRQFSTASMATLRDKITTFQATVNI